MQQEAMPASAKEVFDGNLALDVVQMEGPVSTRDSPRYTLRRNSRIRPLLITSPGRSRRVSHTATTPFSIGPR